MQIVKNIEVWLNIFLSAYFIALDLFLYLVYTNIIINVVQKNVYK